MVTPRKTLKRSLKHAARSSRNTLRRPTKIRWGHPLNILQVLSKTSRTPQNALGTLRTPCGTPKTRCGHPENTMRYSPDCRRYSPATESSKACSGCQNKGENCNEQKIIIFVPPPCRLCGYLPHPMQRDPRGRVSSCLLRIHAYTYIHTRNTYSIEFGTICHFWRSVINKNFEQWSWKNFWTRVAKTRYVTKLIKKCLVSWNSRIGIHTLYT